MSLVWFGQAFAKFILLYIFWCGSCCSCDGGKIKSTPSPKTEVWTLDWSLTTIGTHVVTYATDVHCFLQNYFGQNLRGGMYKMYP